MGAGRGRVVDYESTREGTCTVWMFVEPCRGWRELPVTNRRTAVDRAARIRALVDAPRYAEAERFPLVGDNGNTHDFGSLCTAVDAAEAKRILDRPELAVTPKHGSWLNIAESEPSALTRQSLDDRLEGATAVQQRATSGVQDRNNKQVGADRQFTTSAARTKFKRFYRRIEICRSTRV